MSNFPYIDYIKQEKQIMPADPDLGHFARVINNSLDKWLEQALFRIRDSDASDIQRFGGLDVKYWYDVSRQTVFKLYEDTPNFGLFLSLYESSTDDWFQSLLDTIEGVADAG